jgi:hypothetical protein
MFHYRSFWLPLMNKDLIQAKTLELLGQLQPEGEGAFKPLCIYAAGMALWESFGLSTIPVATV